MAEDSAGARAFLTLKAETRGVAKHSDLSGFLPTNVRIDFSKPVVIFSPRNSPGEKIAIKHLAASNGLRDRAHLRTNGGSLIIAGDALDYTLLFPLAAQPAGQAYTVTLEAFDRDSTPQETARPNRPYTVTVYYLENISAQLVAGDGKQIITTHLIKNPSQSRIFAASLRVTGGTGNYQYTGNSISGGSLTITEDGNIYVPASIIPSQTPKEIIYAIEINNKEEALQAPSNFILTLTLNYQLGAGRPLNVRLINLGDAPRPRAPNVHYYLKGENLSARRPAAVLEVTGGVPPYRYETYHEFRGFVPLEVDGPTVYFKAGDSIRPGGNFHSLERKVEIKISDRSVEGNFETIAVSALIREIDPFGDLDLELRTALTTEFNYRRVQLVPGQNLKYYRNKASSNEIPLLRVIAPIAFSVGSLRKISGALDFIETPDKQNLAVKDEILIPRNIIPRGQTLSIVLVASDGEATLLNRTRPDKKYTIAVRYIPKIALVLKTPEGEKITNRLLIRRPAAAQVPVAKVSVIGTSDNYAYAGAAVEGPALTINAAGEIYIPPTIEPTESGIEIKYENYGNRSKCGQLRAPQY